MTGGILDGCFLPFNPSTFVLHFQMAMVVLEDCSFVSSSHYALVPHPLVAMVVLQGYFV